MFERQKPSKDTVMHDSITYWVIIQIKMNVFISSWCNVETVPLQELELRRKTLWECPCFSTLWKVCNPSEGIPVDVTDGDDVGTRKYKSTCGGDSGSFCCSVSSLCVFILFIVVCLWKSGILLSLWQAKIGKWTSNLSGCVFLPARVLLRVGIHSLCVACQGAEHARSALKGAHCPHCVRLMMRMLRSQRALFEEGALSSVPRSSDPTSAKAEPCQCCRHIKLTCWKRWTRGRRY